MPEHERSTGDEMSASRSARRLRVAAMGFALLLVAALVLGIALGVRAVGADPAWGDDRPAGQVTGGGDPAGSRRDPAQVGQGTLRWQTREGGEVALRVDRAETISRGSPDLRSGWDGPAPCQEYFLVEMTIQYSGAASWDPAEQLTVLRMTSPFGTAGASPGTEFLAEPLQGGSAPMEDGETRTGTVVFIEGAGTDWNHHLVIGTDDGRWMHVQPAGTAETRASC